MNTADTGLGFELEIANKRQELIAFGYVHKVEKEPELILLYIIQCLNCIFDVNFDSKCPSKHGFSLFTGHKVQAIGNTGDNLICNTEQIKYKMNISLQIYPQIHDHIELY